MSENYALKCVYKLIVHVVRHVLAANMYTAVLKTLTKYVSEITPPNETDKNTYGLFRDGAGSDKRAEYIYKITNTILTEQTSKLSGYMIGEMPKLLIKYILKIYDDKYDDAKNIESIDSIFEQILVIIQSSSVLKIDDDSSLIINIKDYLFPYYAEIFSMTISKMKIMVDNYARMIVNQGIHVEILMDVLARAKKESN